MKPEHVASLGAIACAAVLMAATASASPGGGLNDLPSLRRRPMPRIPATMLVPRKSETVAEAEARRAAMLDATRGTKEGLIGGRLPVLEPVSLTEPGKAAERLQGPPRNKPKLILKEPPRFPKPELVLESLADGSKAR